jgi:hypothetical protein
MSHDNAGGLACILGNDADHYGPELNTQRLFGTAASQATQLEDHSSSVYDHTICAALNEPEGREKPREAV